MSVEVGRCSSLANQGITAQDAVAQLTEQIGNAVTTLTQAINDLHDEMCQEMQDFRLRLDDIAVTRPELILSPLKNPDTHQIVQLPNTARQLGALRVTEVEHYLQQLGQQPVGSADEKKAQLMEYMGINIGFWAIVN